MAINFLNFNKRADIGDYDDARNPYTGIDPAIQSTAFFLTNQSGCNTLSYQFLLNNLRWKVLNDYII